MTDIHGFLKYPRRPVPLRPVGERLGDWGEVYAGQALLPVVSEQAARCMDCGIPFCHNGCPLGNLIPEWNVYAAHGDWRAAAERLHATNNFPEFTGRLCPAPCEDACVLAIDSEPVTIKNVEQAIADQIWERGYAEPQPPGRLSEKRVAVVGSGPAGLAAAQQLTRSGHTVAVYERTDRVGGLLRYGIPDFRMEKLQLDRRIRQMEAEGTVFRTGVDVGGDLDAAELARRHDAVVIAVGATERRELPVPGRDLSGIHQAMDYLTLANRVVAGDYAVSPISAEGKHVVVVGGGDTGSDCLGTALRQGAISAVQLDINPEPLETRPETDPWPTCPRIYRISHAHEEARGRAGRDPRVFSAATLRFEGSAGGQVRALHLTEVEPRARRPLPGTQRVIPAELVLLALGFSGPEPDTGLMRQLGLSLDSRGNIARDGGFAAKPADRADGTDEADRANRADGTDEADRADRADRVDGTKEPDMTDAPGSPADGIFVAGDAGRGQSLVVWAIAEGRSAAAAADRHLTGTTALHAPVTPDDGPFTV